MEVKSEFYLAVIPMLLLNFAADSNRNVLSSFQKRKDRPTERVGMLVAWAAPCGFVQSLQR